MSAVSKLVTTTESLNPDLPALQCLSSSEQVHEFLTAPSEWGDIIFTITTFLRLAQINSCARVNQAWNEAFSMYLEIVDIDGRAIRTWSQLRSVYNGVKLKYPQNYHKLSAITIRECTNFPYDALIEFLSHFKLLRYISIDGVDIRKPFFALIARQKLLQKLQLSNIPRIDRYPLFLPMALRSMTFDNTVPIVHPLVRLLDTVCAARQPLTYDAFDHLLRLTYQLRVLRFDECSIFMPFHTCLYLVTSYCPQLDELSFHKSEIRTTYVPLDPFDQTKSTMQTELQNMEHKNLTNLSLFGVKIDETFEKSFLGDNGKWLYKLFPNLQKLNVAKCQRLFEFYDVFHLITNSSSITHLNLSQCSLLFYKDIKARYEKEIKKRFEPQQPISPSKPFRSHRQPSLPNFFATHETLTQMSNRQLFAQLMTPGCERLVELNLSRNYVLTSDWLKPWLPKCVNLQSLNISYCCRISAIPLHKLLSELIEEQTFVHNGTQQLKIVKMRGIRSISGNPQFREGMNHLKSLNLEVDCIKYPIVIEVNPESLEEKSRDDPNREIWTVEFGHHQINYKAIEFGQIPFIFDPFQYSYNCNRRRAWRKKFDGAKKARKAYLVDMGGEQLQISDRMDQQRLYHNPKPVTCPDCHLSYPIIYADDHKLGCLERSIQCPVCNETMHHNLISTHWNDKCKAYYINCGDCGLDCLGRSAYLEHLAQHWLEFDQHYHSNWLHFPHKKEHDHLRQRSLSDADSDIDIDVDIDESDTTTTHCLHLSAVKVCRTCGERVVKGLYETQFPFHDCKLNLVKKQIQNSILNLPSTATITEHKSDS